MATTQADGTKARGSRSEQPGRTGEPSRIPAFADQWQPRPGVRVWHRRRLIDLIDRATRRRVTVVCAPAGTGKTVACSAWAAARAATRPIVWLTLVPEDDPAWFWARVYAGLKRACAAPPELMSALEDGPASTFPLRLAEVARLFSQPAVIVLDNADNLTDDGVLTGLDLLARHAPPGLHLVMCGRRPPRLHLTRLRTSGDLAEIGPAALSAGLPISRVSGPERAPRRVTHYG